MKTRLNDKEREMWIMNDEGLYLWFKQWCRYNRSQSMTKFLKENRQELDEIITRKLG